MKKIFCKKNHGKNLGKKIHGKIFGKEIHGKNIW